MTSATPNAAAAVDDAYRPTIVVIGLGYVGLPLAVALSRSFDTWGVDIDEGRVAELRGRHDRTREIDAETLAASTLRLTHRPEECPPAHVYIVTVPTPVDDAKRPDLRMVEAASRTVATMLDGELTPLVIYESTVYPGVTEELCGAILERESGLKRGVGFFLGYSPERINPGDREHTVDRIVKVVAGENPEVTANMTRIYGAVTSAGTYEAASIKAAEAAKVIENAQRDINIAFMNEITQIFARVDLSIWDVLGAARTKWNFLPFTPGFVGGHCIGVDPYYLSHRARELGLEPQVILAGRATNDSMANWVADELHTRRGARAGSVLVMGLTFKENVPDLRNSKVADLIRRLEWLGHDVTVHDPLADAGEAMHEYGVALDGDALGRTYDMVVAAVAHDEYRALTFDRIDALVAPGGLLADPRDLFRGVATRPDVGRWTL